MEFGSPLRKLAKIALIVCLVVLGVPAVLFASLWLWFSYQTAKVDGFYREHRLLGVMREAEKKSTNDSTPARDALFRMVSLGTDRETVIAFLHKEKLGCKAAAEPITDVELRKRLHLARQGNELVNCQTMSPAVFGHKQWIVDLEFDGDGRLSDARVAIWNISL